MHKDVMTKEIRSKTLGLILCTPWAVGIIGSSPVVFGVEKTKIPYLSKKKAPFKANQKNQGHDDQETPMPLELGLIKMCDSYQDQAKDCSRVPDGLYPALPEKTIQSHTPILSKQERKSIKRANQKKKKAGIPHNPQEHKEEAGMVVNHKRITLEVTPEDKGIDEAMLHQFKLELQEYLRDLIGLLEQQEGVLFHQEAQQRSLKTLKEECRDVHTILHKYEDSFFLKCLAENSATVLKNVEQLEKNLNAFSARGHIKIPTRNGAFFLIELEDQSGEPLYSHQIKRVRTLLKKIRQENVLKTFGINYGVQKNHDAAQSLSVEIRACWLKLRDLVKNSPFSKYRLKEDANFNPILSLTKVEFNKNSFGQAKNRLHNPEEEKH